MHFLSCIASGLLATHVASASPPWYDHPDPHHPGHDNAGDKLGAVSSENKICSNIGLDALRKGGNAADSTVATVFCVGVTSMWHSGIGGGGYLLVRYCHSLSSPKSFQSDKLQEVMRPSMSS